MGISGAGMILSFITDRLLLLYGGVTGGWEP